MDEEIIDDIKDVYVDCPECTYMDDDQYQCCTCGAGGGQGRINVYEFLKEHFGKG